jgi:hypothetical protein
MFFGQISVQFLKAIHIVFLFIGLLFAAATTYELRRCLHLLVLLRMRSHAQPGSHDAVFFGSGGLYRQEGGQESAASPRV